MDEGLDIQDYLDATGDSAKRSRTIAIIVVITCVLVFVGLLNSLRSNWMLSRIHESEYPNSEYIVEKLGAPPPNWATSDGRVGAIRYYDVRYKEFVSAMTRAYVESAMLVRVPFFGMTVDVNDLGLLGGITFLILLTWYRFSLSREVDNLRLSFSEANQLGQLKEFYNLLAMRQVFTVPKTSHIRRTPLLVWVPKIICWLPVILHCSVMAYDIRNTSDIGEMLSHGRQGRFGVLVFTEISLAFALFVLASMATQRLRRIDKIWDKQWEEIRLKPSSTTKAQGQKPNPCEALAAE